MKTNFCSCGPYSEINKIQQEGFDGTKLKIQAYLDEIKQKQQQKIRYNKTKYIKFVSDRAQAPVLYRQI
jgi:hypothetical protein